MVVIIVVVLVVVVLAQAWCVGERVRRAWDVLWAAVMILARVPA